MRYTDDDLQYYQTSDALADRCVGMLSELACARPLDACAGKGALADALMRRYMDRHGRIHRHTAPRIDVVELDGRHHPT